MAGRACDFPALYFDFGFCGKGAEGCLNGWGQFNREDRREAQRDAEWLNYTLRFSLRYLAHFAVK
jgi:hypothetical protein